MARIVEWFWDFGDGEFSREQNPYHTYKTSGIYTVSVIVKDDAGNIAKDVKTDYITITEDHNLIKDLPYSDYKKSFHYTVDVESGGGWSEVSGDDWVWPESKNAILEIIDDQEHKLKVVFDSRSGQPYVINTRVGPNSQNYDISLYDKLDQPENTNGTNIATVLQLPEMVGENRHYKVKHEESFIDIRADDIDSGMQSGQQIDIALYKDGSVVTAYDSLTDIDITSEQLFDRKQYIWGDSNQLKISASNSGFAIYNVESYLKTDDIARYTTVYPTTEGDYYENFGSTHEIWLTRGVKGYLHNRSSQSDIDAGAYSAAVGPDGLTNSAATITTSFQLGNIAYNNTTTATFLLWHKVGYTITDVTLTEVSNNGTWYLSYCKPTLPEEGVRDLPANITLPAGDVYDVRLLSGVKLSDAELTHYYNDVINNQGKLYLPRF